MVIMIAAVVLSAAAHAADAGTGSFSAAVYASSRLVVFPLDAKEFSVPLPLTIRYLAFGASGQSLYATAFTQLSATSLTSAPGLMKIEFNPVRVNRIPGFEAFYGIDRFAVSRREDLIAFGGARRDAAGTTTCGIYKYAMPSASPQPIVETSNCRAGSPWRVLDISPTTEEALILANRRLARLDLISGAISPLGSQLWGGSFSPDGKWIAALDLGGPSTPSRTILIDPKDSDRRRDLGGLNDDEVVWSPDSRFILHAVPQPACPSQNPLALETIDIETGKRAVIPNSVCNTGLTRQMGWVRNDIAR